MLRLYNTLSRKTEDFVPLAPPTVTMYVCGPTVYDEPHIGHARSACIFDILSRYLAFKTFQVRFIRNVTDVDDKIIEKARQETRDSRLETQDLAEQCREVSERCLQSYHAAMDRLGIGRPTEEPRATRHVVPDMTDFISKLLMNGIAYEAGGDVYFAVRKFPEYGRLSNRSIDELQSSARGEHPAHAEAPGGAGKRDPLDFALWKAAKPGEPSWNSPWGQGRPGWHIECSTMSTKYLGDEFDIHGGGVDLVFPHHENEIAQAHAAGKPFARTWIHNGLLTVNGEKMSKSLGNFITVEDALTRAGTADALKTFFLGAHYRSPVDYSEASITAARRRFEGIDGFLQRAAAQRAAKAPQPVIDALRQRFIDAMDQDLNTPEALAVIDQAAQAGYGVAEAVRELCRVLGLFSHDEPKAVEVTADVQALVQQREAARKHRDFQTADRLRKEVESQGFIIEDTPSGPLILRKR